MKLGNKQDFRAQVNHIKKLIEGNLKHDWKKKEAEIF